MQFLMQFWGEQNGICGGYCGGYCTVGNESSESDLPDSAGIGIYKWLGKYSGSTSALFC